MQVQHYFDYKSPYAYLAQQDALALNDIADVELQLIPYTLDIPAYLGSAQVDDQGNVVADRRNAHQWRRVRYAYMDCRREANRRGLTVKGPRKIFNSQLAHSGFLFAQREPEAQLEYHHTVYRKFWNRELDVEDATAITTELAAVGLNASEFGDFHQQQGLTLLAQLASEAEAHGVFGVPSFRVAGQLFWGNERFAHVRELLCADT